MNLKQLYKNIRSRGSDPFFGAFREFLKKISTKECQSPSEEEPTCDCDNACCKCCCSAEKQIKKPKVVGWTTISQFIIKNRIISNSRLYLLFQRHADFRKLCSKKNHGVCLIHNEKALLCFYLTRISPQAHEMVRGLGRVKKLTIDHPNWTKEVLDFRTENPEFWEKLPGGRYA